MKTLITAVTMVACTLLYHQTHAQQTNTYDSVLAKKLNADDYGMKMYTLIILKKGPVNITDTKLRDSIFHGHMANILHLAAENKLLLAGPMGKNDKEYEGIFVFNTADTTEAKQWLNKDPAIQLQDLDAEIFPWYGPAALQRVVDINKTLQKKSF